MLRVCFLARGERCCCGWERCSIMRRLALPSVCLSSKYKPRLAACNAILSSTPFTNASSGRGALRTATRLHNHAKLPADRQCAITSDICNCRGTDDAEMVSRERRWPSGRGSRRCRRHGPATRPPRRPRCCNLRARCMPLSSQVAQPLQPVTSWRTQQTAIQAKNPRYRCVSLGCLAPASRTRRGYERDAAEFIAFGVST